MVNWNLIKCAFGYHIYGNPISNDTLNTIERICINCNKVISVVNRDKIKNYELDKEEIINDIKLDKLCHARTKINRLLKKLGY